MKRTIGGPRLNSGNKMQVDLHGYGRSTHNLSNKVMLTAAPGVIYPVWKQVVMPEDTWDVHLQMEAMTKPTNGPLFDTYEIEAHMFEAPWRLYNGDVHNNEIGIGNDMSKIKIPLITLSAAGKGTNKVYNPTEQINPSALPAMMGIPGIGRQIMSDTTPAIIQRDFNTIPILAYWEIFKNYFANVQEDNAYVIHAAPVQKNTIGTISVRNAGTDTLIPASPAGGGTAPIFNATTLLVITTTAGLSASQIPQLLSSISINTANEGAVRANYLFAPSTQTGTGITTIITGVAQRANTTAINWAQDTSNAEVQPQLSAFPLVNIDEIRRRIMRHTGNAAAWNLTNDGGNLTPYSYLWSSNGAGGSISSFAIQYSQEGLAVGTYKSDINNNWIKSETIASVATRTAINTGAGSFTIDTLNIQEKIYNYLNRIAVSGGTYNDWIETTYDSNRVQMSETPIYHGGLIKEIGFQEVVSTAAADTVDGTNQPLGQLAGRGKMTEKHKGGSMTIHVREPGYIMLMLKITPRITYSQGIDWDMNLLTFDDLHKPALDGIGFQDLIAETMDWRSTEINSTGMAVTKKAIGKQPAWIQYQTNINKSYGEFAQPTEMFMTLNRQYEANNATGGILDGTTYIDPKKYNNIFADTKISAMNFWVQIGVNATARRKMSANQIPQM